MKWNWQVRGNLIMIQFPAVKLAVYGFETSFRRQNWRKYITLNSISTEIQEPSDLVCMQVDYVVDRFATEVDQVELM